MESATTDVRVEKSNAFNYIQSPFLRISVGGEAGPKEFFVHQGLICQHSDFFKKAIEGPWQESEQRAVSLPADDPDVFSLYLILLYTNKLPIKQVVQAVEMCDEYYDLSRLFVLAEKLVDTTTKGLVLAAMIAHSQEMCPHRRFLCYPTIESIQIIYHGTPEGSPARELFVKYYTEHGMSSFLTTTGSVVPKDFLYELSVSILGTRPLLSDYTELKEKHDYTSKMYGHLMKMHSKSFAECTKITKELTAKNEECVELAAKCENVKSHLESTQNELKIVKAELELSKVIPDWDFRRLDHPNEKNTLYESKDS
ncbi:ankyrin repeat-containing protein [Stagonosporopsis vannaccii]|nr:ankyrin repeat-containing protein [Stagonosporopsis vannaccii]